uniref:Uncharacterized protein n=1 Tax=Meloidogyne enterolobii TaxID=390850 RepID=A0A6V7UDD3_MELEN|nr:unnamed protein product [Meloidogyne enterolobii]
MSFLQNSLELDSRMCFWAVNVYFLNLYASLDGENNKVEKVRNMFYKQTNIDVKRLLRELLEKFCFILNLKLLNY